MEVHTQISVIVPVYKVEQYLPKCIDSILAQTFSDFELLLVDDGSPDRSGEICDEYVRKDGRIRVFHQENAGVSAARNKGLDCAQGIYIAFIDSDDYVEPDYLNSLYQELPADKSWKGVVTGGFDRLAPDGSLHTVHVQICDVFPADYSCVLTELIDKNVMYSWAKLYDNRLLQEQNIRFITSVSCREDALFMLDYLLYADFLFTRDISNYIYRVDYSTSTLSTCIKDFQSEYAAFSNFQDRVYRYQQIYCLPDDALGEVWNSQTVFFHKIIMAIYKKDNHNTRKERLSCLKEVLSAYSGWIRRSFVPQYKADRVAKFLLLNVGIAAFDCWMKFLFVIKFKYMFGARK